MKYYRENNIQRILKIEERQVEIYNRMKEVVAKSSNNDNSRLKQIGGKLLAGKLNKYNNTIR